MVRVKVRLTSRPHNDVVIGDEWLAQCIKMHWLQCCFPAGETVLVASPIGYFGNPVQFVPGCNI